MILTYTPTAAEEKALKYMAASPQDWFANFVQHRARVAMQEIYDAEVARMRADPNVTSIPVNVEDVVLAATIVFADAQPELPPMPIPPNN